MYFINFVINFDLNWSKNCIIVANNADQVTKFLINDTNIYVPIETLLSEVNAKFLEQLKSGFKRTINWNKY